MSDHREDSVSDVSCADVTLFKNGTETVPPSSEVGSQEISTHTTSSSARLPPEQLEPANNQRREPVLVSNASTEAISQSRPHTYHDQGMRMDGIPPQFLMQMMEMMQRMSERLCAPPTESKIRIKDIYLPSFDPDTHVGVREWCQHIDQAIEAYKLSDFDVRMKVCSLLKGRAKMWVDDWMVNSSTWEELRKNLITTFEPENRYSRDIAMFREHVYDSSKDIAEFLSRAWILWRRVTKDKLGDEHAVEAVIGCVNDERLRIEEFLGEFKDYCDHAGINIHAIAPGVSRANGQVERVVATLKNALVMIKNYETEQWHTTLEELQLAMNCTTHRVTGVAPLTLITQRKHCVPSELLSIVNIDTETVDIEALSQQVLQKMSRSSEQDRQRFNQHKAKIHHFQIGDYVLIKNNPRNQTSLDLKFSEPYEVSRVLENDRYLVKKVVGRGRPRKVAHDQLRRAPQPGEQLTVSAGNGSPGHQESAAFEPIPSTSRDPENHELQGENNSPE
ncbi:hypothetical protein HF086_000956 [Spodoptera exigua]|uniref:Integrase catalytic domain-containing protein n=1 Tax=Spodoptera exigua TaxID=7107 RepID=A0A922SI47_SPOEX|nr:hypothetical protein HF086_000956 [Spodoptera exigua]